MNCGVVRVVHRSNDLVKRQRWRKWDWMGVLWVSEGRGRARRHGWWHLMMWCDGMMPMAHWNIYIYIYLSFFLSFQNSTWASLFFHLGTHVGKFLHVKLSLTSTRLTCALFTTVSLGCGSVYVAIFATVRSIYYKTKLEFTQNNFDLLIY